ncbi:MAG: GGDEF-domain containing protein, partial [Allosphingosinicella sp.]
MAGIFFNSRPAAGSTARRDMVAIGVALATLTIFVSFSSEYVEQLRGQLVKLGASNSSVIVGLLLLNVALTIYGWRRYREVEERTAAERRAHSLASSDPLTGFLNRRSFAQAANELMA